MRSESPAEIAGLFSLFLLKLIVSCLSILAVCKSGYELGGGLDPRIRRTRRLLLHGLGKLLETKEFDKISVQDIAEAATVNRATFDDHYTDKFDLLECDGGGCALASCWRPAAFASRAAVRVPCALSCRGYATTW